MNILDLDKETKAMQIVKDYVDKHLDVTDNEPKYEIYIVIKSYVLGNVKFMISTSLPDGMYYEVTYNSSKSEWYLDAYKKFENIVIPEK